jgi:hypothetical protein
MGGRNFLGYILRKFMGERDDIYWQRWQKLLEAAVNFQELLTGSVMIGGSAAAVHLKHRYSFDADHILSDLIRGRQASPIVQLVRQLAEPKPGDFEQVDLSEYKGIQPPFDFWDYIVTICEEISVQLGDRL